MNRQVTYLPESADRVIIAANPRAGARSGRPLVEELTALLEQQPYRVEVITDKAQLAETVEKSLAAGDLRSVVAAGGDGTLGLVVNLTSPDAPISVLPLGTENLLSSYLGVLPSPEEVCQGIIHGASIKLDAGMVNGRCFLLMMSCGFDAEVVQRMDSERRGHINRLSYLKPIVDSIRSYRYPEMRIYCDDEPEPCFRVRWAFVVNLPRYAIGLQIAPDASGLDGQLDLCTFRQGSLWHGLRYLAGARMGWHRTWADFVQRKVRRLRIESDENVPYQIDGDPGGMLPAEIEVAPERLNLVAPLSWLAIQGLAPNEAAQP